MAKIECPICEDDVSSAENLGLGEALKHHLMSTHRMVSLGCIDMVSGVEPAKELVTYRVEKTVTEERPLGSEDPRTGRMEAIVDDPLAGEYGRTSRTSSSSRVVSESKPEAELEDVRQTAPEFVIKCPFCNEVLRADDDDDLGDDLKDHWGDVHQLRPTIRAKMGMTRRA